MSSPEREARAVVAGVARCPVGRGVRLEEESLAEETAVVMTEVVRYEWR